MSTARVLESPGNPASPPSELNPEVRLQQILDEIKQMPAAERLMIAETAVRSLREEYLAIDEQREQLRQRMVAAAEALRWDYENDPELTAFTALDGEDFYDYEER